MERLVFDAAAVLTIFFASVMVLHRHPVKSVLALVVSFFGLAGCFVLLSAPFVAAIQVIVYAGAILVLFLFVLMLLNVPQEEHRRDTRPIQRYLSGAAILVFAAIVLGLLRSHGAPDHALASAADRAASSEIAPLARLLFSEYLLAFEALSILLLAALVGAFVLAGRRKSGARP
jgi:NADH-quinone oxidoreductase subunit J